MKIITLCFVSLVACAPTYSNPNYHSPINDLPPTDFDLELSDHSIGFLPPRIASPEEQDRKLRQVGSIR
jgi:hypothetical protein